jgi:hypothetical protein
VSRDNYKRPYFRRSPVREADDPPEKRPAPQLNQGDIVEYFTSDFLAKNPGANTVDFVLKSVSFYVRTLRRKGFPIPFSWEVLRLQAAGYYRNRIETLALYRREAEFRQHSLEIKHRLLRNSIGPEGKLAHISYIERSGTDVQPTQLTAYQQQTLFNQFSAFLQQGANSTSTAALGSVLPPPPPPPSLPRITEVDDEPTASTAPSKSGAELHRTWRHLHSGLREIQKNTERHAAALPDVLLTVEALCKATCGKAVNEKY